MKRKKAARAPVETPEPAGEAERTRRLLASASYRIAFEDREFLMRHDLRPLRLQLELLKPEMVLRKHAIKYTIVVFGGTRIVEPAVAQARLAALETERRTAPGPEVDRRIRIAQRVVAKSHYYEAAREFARLASQSSRNGSPYVVVTGGGPGIMEAANRGAFDAGMKSIGLNITLPMEQAPNSYITPELCFQFHYFAVRKMHFLLRAQAMVAFPGGYGTMDELFEALTLMQTGKTHVMPVVLFGREFWEKALDLRFLSDEGTIADRDLELLHYADTPQEAWDHILAFHAERDARRSKPRR